MTGPSNFGAGGQTHAESEALRDTAWRQRRAAVTLPEGPCLICGLLGMHGVPGGYLCAGHAAEFARSLGVDAAALAARSVPAARAEDGLGPYDADESAALRFAQNTSVPVARPALLIERGFDHARRFYAARPVPAAPTERLANVDLLCPEHDTHFAPDPGGICRSCKRPRGGHAARSSVSAAPSFETAWRELMGAENKIGDPSRDRAFFDAGRASVDDRYEVDGPLGPLGYPSVPAALTHYLRPDAEDAGHESATGCGALPLLAEPSSDVVNVDCVLCLRLLASVPAVQPGDVRDAAEEVLDYQGDYPTDLTNNPGWQRAFTRLRAALDATAGQS